MEIKYTELTINWESKPIIVPMYALVRDSLFLPVPPWEVSNEETSHVYVGITEDKCISFKFSDTYMTFIEETLHDLTPVKNILDNKIIKRITKEEFEAKLEEFKTQINKPKCEQ